MGSGYINNPEGWEQGLPLNVPPADAWDKMRTILDEEMPAPAMLLPGQVVVYAGNGLMRGIYLLFLLLLMGSAAGWLIGSKAAGSSGTSKQLDGKSFLPKPVVVGKPMAAPEPAGNSYVPKPVAKATLLANGIGVNKRQGPQHFTKKTKNIPLLLATTLPLAHFSEQSAGVMDATPVAVTDSVFNQLAKKGNTKAPVIANADAALHETVADKKEDKTPVQVEAGLQWQAQWPLSSASQYFAGPGGGSKPGRLLMPGIWVSVQADRYWAVAEVTPFASTVFNPKPFATTTQVNGQSSLVETKGLNKMFGVTAALRCNYNIVGHWWAGGGLETVFWKKGLATVNYTMDDNGQTTSGQKLASLGDSDWVHLAKFQIRTGAEIMYKATEWHAGLRASVFFTPVAKDHNGAKSPFVVEMFFRWRLFSFEKRQ